MTQITDVNLKNTEVDEDSGDIYIDVELTLLEPGAAFIQQKEKIIDRIKHKIKHTEIL